MAAVFAWRRCLVGATSANADQYDFIDRLDANGVAYTGYASDTIDLGKTVCHELRMVSQKSDGARTCLAY